MFTKPDDVCGCVFFFVLPMCCIFMKKTDAAAQKIYFK